MKLTTKQDIAKYLKQAMDLEVSVYSQEKAITDSEDFLNQNTPRRQRPNKQKPKKQTIPEPEKPKEPKLIDIQWQIRNLESKKAAEKKQQKKDSELGVKIGGAIIFFVLCIVFGLILGNVFIGLFIGVVIAFAITGVIIKDYEDNKKRMAKIDAGFDPRALEAQNAKKIADYEAEMKKYNEAMIQYKKDSDKINEEYLKEVEKSEEEYKKKEETANAQYSIAKANYSLAKNKVDILKNNLNRTKTVLKQLYELDILFPKYRNLIAVSTMYEYFASGRVSEFEGPDGAYNLYESELRQNLIINRLEIIIEQLEDIKTNQYSLYIELKEVNKTLSFISSDISRIVQSTEKIADNTNVIAENSKDISENTRKIAKNSDSIAQASHITAYCAKVTAQNTEALKYITLING